MNNIHFSCTGCGKCCDGSPQMSLIDAFRLSDQFIFRHSFNIFELNEEYPKEDLDFAMKITVPLYNLGKKRFFYEMNIKAVSLTDGVCDKLTPDNMCSINEKKPSLCRLMPFTIAYGEREPSILKRLNPFKDKYKDDCDFSEDANIIWTDGKYVNDSKIAYEKQIEDRLLENNVLRGMTKEARKYKPLMKFIKSFKNKESIPIMTISQFSMGIVHEKIFTKEEVITFINNQNKLIKDALETRKLTDDQIYVFNAYLEINTEQLELLHKVEI